MLTMWLAKTLGSLPKAQVNPVKRGVSEGTRTPDTQDHNLVL
jgi:hypothetical protein